MLILLTTIATQTQANLTTNDHAFPVGEPIYSATASNILEFQSRGRCFNLNQTNEPGRGCQSEAVSKIFDLNHCFGEDFFLEEGF